MIAAFARSVSGSLKIVSAIFACTQQKSKEASLHTFFRKLIDNESGVTAIEYALIAALIAVAAIAAFSLVGTNLSTTFSTVTSQL